MTIDNILFVDGSPVHGGAQRSLLSLMCRLRSRGIGCRLLAGAEELVAAAGAAGIPVEHVALTVWTRSLTGMLRAAEDSIRFRSVLREALAADNPQLVYANGVQAGLLASVSLPATVPLVFHHRDIRCPRFALKRVASRAVRTIVLSDYMLEQCRQIVSARSGERMVRVYNGFDFDELAGQAADGSAAESDIVLVADMARWKGHDLFLRAFAAATDCGLNARAVVIGGPRCAVDESWYDELRRLAGRLVNEGRVEFIGHVPNALPHIRQARLLCSVADEEPFGRTIVEAIGLRTPVLIAGEGGPKEIVQGLGTAIVVERTVDAIADAMPRALMQEKNNAPPAWQKRFSIEQHTNNIVNIISSI